MILPGNLIEFIDSGKFNCAFVTESSGAKLRLLGQNGRDINLAQSRIVCVSKNRHPFDADRDSLVAELKATALEREKMAGEIDLQEIWEIASEDPVREFSVTFLAELIFGESVNDDQVAAFVRAVFADRFYFKFKAGRITVHSQEQVDQLRHQMEKEAEKEQIIAIGSSALSRIMQGEQVADIDWPEKENVLDWIEETELIGNESPHADLVRQLLKKASLTGPHDRYHILVRAGRWLVNENIPLRKSGHPVEFSAETVTTASGIHESLLEDLLSDRKRRDLRDLDIFTIDGPDTKAFVAGRSLANQ